MEEASAREGLQSPAAPGDDLVRWAAAESEARLSDLGDRWLHVQGVAEKAARIGRAFDGEDRAYLLAAAHLHDVGYSPSLSVTGLHQLDGAAHLRALGQERLARLVATTRRHGSSSSCGAGRPTSPSSPGNPRRLRRH
jgi:HD superfamily phosphodiesterase